MGLPDDLVGKNRSILQSDNAKSEWWICHFFTRLEILKILPCSPDPITMRIGQLKLAVCLPPKTEKPP